MLDQGLLHCCEKNISFMAYPFGSLPVYISFSCRIGMEAILAVILIGTLWRYGKGRKKSHSKTKIQNRIIDSLTSKYAYASLVTTTIICSDELFSENAEHKLQCRKWRTLWGRRNTAKTLQSLSPAVNEHGASTLESVCFTYGSCAATKNPSPHFLFQPNTET